MSKKEKILIGLVIIFILSLFIASISLFKSPTTLEEKVELPKENFQEKESVPLIEEPIKNTAYLYIEDVKYEGEVKQEESIYTFMTNLQKAGKITFKEKTYSGLGKFIEEINGIKGKDGKYWIYYVNGKKGEISVSKYKLNPGDVVSWKYEDDLQNY